MITFQGRVAHGFGVATPNLQSLGPFIASRTGFVSLVPGTLNLRIDSPYFVKPDAAISAREYNGLEVILLQRAVLNGLRVLIMRPHTHELSESWGYGATQLELMAPVRLRDFLSLKDGDLVRVEAEGDGEWWTSARSAI